MPILFNIEKQHSKIVSKGTLFKILKYIDQNDPPTPVLLIDKEKIREKATLIGSGVENSRVFYAVKANADIEILRLLNAMGVGFEIASDGELKALAALGVESDRIISSNPMKTIPFMRAAAEYGLSYFAFDSREEVDKIAAYIPGAMVYVRLTVPNEGSQWPLGKKFGVELQDALSLLLYAREKGLNPIGLTFHVGSQCTNMYNWNIGAYKGRELWEMAIDEGLNMRVLNIGGGYPINYTKGVIGIAEIEKNIDSLMKDNFPQGTEIFIEPGRSVVGDGGIFVATITGKAKRADAHWLYIDVGVFNGMMESIGGIKYSYITQQSPQQGERQRYIISGPSCDSFDVMDNEISLFEPEVGSKILILSAGAYTVAYGSEFNGFGIPKTILI